MKQKLLIFTSVLTFVFSWNHYAKAQWKQTSGPSITFSQDTAGAYSIAAISGTILVGTESGVSKSTDSGQTWTNVFDSGSCFVTTIGTTIYAGCTVEDAGGEIFRSTDKGMTWSKTLGQIAGAEGNDVFQLTSNNGVLFVGIGGPYFYRSTNDGVSWDSSLSDYVNQIDVISASNSRLFAWTDQGSNHPSYQSTDTGASWTSFTISGSNVFGVATSGDFVVAKTKNGFYYSTDDGTNWSTASGLSGGIFNLVVNGNFGLENGNHRSTDGGATWIDIPSNIEYMTSTVETNGLLQLGKSIFFCNGGSGIGGFGILQTSDSGSYWNNLTAVQLTSSLDVHSLSVVGSKIIAGTGDSGIYVTTNDGSNWNQSGLSGRTVYSLLSASNYLFAGTDGGSADTSGGIFLSSDTGTSWTGVLNGLANVNALAASNGNLYAGTDSGIYASTNNGTNWETVFQLVHVNALASQGSKVFAGTSANGLIVSTNNGTSWAAFNGTLPISDIQSLVVKGGVLFAGTKGNGLFLSTDTGQSWTDVSSGLPTSSVLSLEENSQQFFAGTDGNGIFRTDDSGKTWKQVDSGLVNLNVTSLGIQNGNLFAGTTAIPGNWTYIDGGVWERPLSQMLISEPASVTQTQTIPSEIHIYPNPFSQSTQITFTSQATGYVEVSIVNMLGVEVARLFSGELGAGEHSFNWDAGKDACTTGTYECLVRMNGQVETQPVVLIR